MNYDSQAAGALRPKGELHHKIIRVRLFQRRDSIAIIRWERPPWWSVLSVCLLKGCNLNISRKLALVISFSLCVCGGGDSIELHDIFFLLLLSFLSFGVFFFFKHISYLSIHQTCPGVSYCNRRPTWTGSDVINKISWSLISLILALWKKAEMMFTAWSVHLLKYQP